MEYINKNPKIFIISGKAKSGKNTLANMICDFYKDKKCIQISYAHYLKNYVKNITGWDGDESNKPRDLLQSIGIDLIKNKIDKHLLIRRVIEDIKVYSYFYDIIVVTDARLLDEIEIPKKYFNVTTIRINNSNNNITNEQKNHITETNLDNYEQFDYVIDDLENINKILEEL